MIENVTLLKLKNIYIYMKKKEQKILTMVNVLYEELDGGSKK